MTLAFIDTETGGLTTDTSLLDVAVVVTDSSLVELDRFSVLTKPDDGVYMVTAGALRVNRIDLLAHDAKATVYQRASLLLDEFIFTHYQKQARPERLILAGWNVNFDAAFLKTYLMTKKSWDQYFEFRYLDGQSVLKFLQVQGKLPDSLGSLASCMKHFELGGQEHTALGDCYSTIAVMKELFNVQ